MKQSSKIMLVVMGFALLAVVLSSVPNHPANAAPGPAPVTVANTPLPVTTPTNSGVPVSKLITLICPGSAAPTQSNDCPAFTAIDATDSLVSNNYTIPTGETLIVTDVNWAGGAPIPSPGNTTSLNLELVNGNAFAPLALYNDRGLTDSNGLVTRNEHLTTGIPMTFLPIVQIAQAGAVNPFSFLILRGYLTP